MSKDLSSSTKKPAASSIQFSSQSQIKSQVQVPPTGRQNSPLKTKPLGSDKKQSKLIVSTLAKSFKLAQSSSSNTKPTPELLKKDKNVSPSKDLIKLEVQPKDTGASEDPEGESHEECLSVLEEEEQEDQESLDQDSVVDDSHSDIAWADVPVYSV